MDLCDAKIISEQAVNTVHDLIDVKGVLTTQNAVIERLVNVPQIPTTATCLQDAKLLFNYKLNRKRVDSEDEEEIAPIVPPPNDDEDSIDEETSEEEESETELLDSEED